MECVIPFAVSLSSIAHVGHPRFAILLTSKIVRLTLDQFPRLHV